MKYLPDQKPAVIRLGRDRVLMLEDALKRYTKSLLRLDIAGGSAARTRDMRKLYLARCAIRALPQCLPYTVIIHAAEWEVISIALRSQGSHPVAGSLAAREYALYDKLRAKCRFLTATQVERDEQRAKARRLRTLRGDFDVHRLTHKRRST